VERERLRVEKEKLLVLKSISADIFNFRSVYMAAHGIQVVEPQPVTEE